MFVIRITPKPNPTAKYRYVYEYNIFFKMSFLRVMYVYRSVVPAGTHTPTGVKCKKFGAVFKCGDISL